MEDILHNLLARIHGDGGQYLEQHGIDKAADDAEQLVSNWRAAFAAQQKALPAQADQNWLPIETAPKDRTEILACWPKRKLDDDECPTGEITGYAQCVTAWQGFWIEPDYLEAHGSFYFEDEAFADAPTHWMPLPAAPKVTP